MLLVAPTGGGKTLAGFLPSLIDLANKLPAGGGRRPRALHTLYISPLKALAVDIARNLETPVAEMGLPIRIETRTGDTPASRRQRQKTLPPDILLTTPEQLALLLASRESALLFADLQAVVLDELHALHNSKRGDLLALGLARLRTLAPDHRSVGLSATVADPKPLIDFLGGGALVRGAAGAKPEISILASDAYVPWSGHLARHAMADVMEAIRRAKTSLVFVNTRSQAELTFQDLWRINDDNLAIALHHGSLDVAQRRKVEAAMTKGKLRAVVCTSTLDLGIDWGAVDKVICIGAPKGAARLVQRIGRANHRLDDPSRALLVPANRFEVLECEAARDAVMAGELDGDRLRIGGPRRAGAACSGQRLRGAVRRGSLVRGSVVRIALPASDAKGFRQGGRFRRHRRLCAQALRPLCAAAQDAGRQVARRPSARGAAIPAQCRRHRRRPDDRYPPAIQGASDRRRRPLARPA